MHDGSVICPWIVPMAGTKLRRIFDEEVARTSTLAARACLYDEATRSHCVSYVKSGVLSQGVINHRLNKPLAMNLYPEGSIQGFLNLFTGEPAPRLVKAISRSTVRSMNRERFRERICADEELIFEYIRYTEIVAKSELLGMEALFSLNLSDRFLLSCSALIVYSGVNPLENSEDYLKLPIPISRASLCNVIYTTKTPLDRLLAKFTKEGIVLRINNDRFVLRKALNLMCEWIFSR